jgi:hypothetical protein
MNTKQVLARLDAAWMDFEESHAGLSESRMAIPGVTQEWSVRDVIAHVSWWDEEALKHLPDIREGRRPPRYSVTYGGIDAFNALMTEKWRKLSLADVIREHLDVHRRLREYVMRVPDELFARETRFRRRLRLDTYGHYPRHAKAIRAWRQR